MELVTEVRKGSQLGKLNEAALRVCDYVEAAIAYVTDEKTLIRTCQNSGKSLKMWVRLDDDLPVKPEILRLLLKFKIECKLVSHIFHTKIIWWHGYGAYVGSANLTDPAWFRNFEAGVFIPEEEMDEAGVSESLQNYLIEIDAASHTLTEELCKEVEDRDKVLRSLPTPPKAKWSIPILESRTMLDNNSAKDKALQAFLKEWNNTLTTLRQLAEMIPDYRPAWMTSNPPKGAQVDRFLHAYYVLTAMESTDRVRELYFENRIAPWAAVERALERWKASTEPPAHVKELLEEWLPLVQGYLAKDKLPKLNAEEFGDLLAHVHAFHDYAVRASWASLGLQGPLEKMEGMQRAKWVGQHVYHLKSGTGSNTPLSLLQYVIYGGSTPDTPKRIFEGYSDQSWRIRHIGLSTLGEIAGWADPDRMPPRNDRTSKALRALGFSVQCRIGNVQ